MWNDHWSIMKPAYFIIWFSFNINLRFSIKWCSRAQKVIYIENRIYIRVEFTKKKWKTAILLNCFHIAGVLHISALYNLLGPGTSFYWKSKINIKKIPNYEIGWFHHLPMPFTLQTMIFRYNLKSNDVCIHLIHFIKFI